MRIILIGDDQCIINFFVKLKSTHDVVAIISTKQHVLDTLKKFKRNIRTYLLEEKTTLNQKLKLEKSMLPGLPNCDLMITAVCQYILPNWLISVPRYGSLNTHFSLLPKYRGGSPITNVLINGEKETGVTFHFMTEEFDKGDIVEQITMEITTKDNEETILDRSREIAKNAVASVVDKVVKINNGTATALKQTDMKIEPSYCTKKLNVIDWTKPTAYIDKVVSMTRVLSLNYFVYQDKKYHILAHDVQLDTDVRADNDNSKNSECIVPGTITNVVPGTVIEDGGRFKIKTGDGYIIAKRCKVLPKIQRN
ncbi:methionyl-tRNA formyltransferase [Yasminevirus sp. GU-2018]|uniref:Methionyl-tRNA formyltransferase n=1 Tax=Yasminevirus sp. GU-2018 TaxID=2420051 RepID=A0A5K0UBN6_9VIRU|nr:methionyl-tRNA formyltransferase [Yasminevirus sp. GU-2018]